jgi:RNA polymerase sigma-54 factor
MTGARPALHLQLGQQMTLTPQLLQSIRMLQLSTLELEQEMRAALERNLMLESTEDDEEEDAAAEANADAGDPAVPAPAGALETDHDWSSRESWSGGDTRDDDEAIDARRAAPESSDIRLRALQQLRLVINDADDARLAVAIVEHIDNGYLETPLAEIAAALPDDLDAGPADLERVLRLVQTVEPTGFGARDLRECLLLQLRTLPCTPVRDLAEFIVCACLERLAGGDLAEVRDALGTDGDAMAAAVDLILSLNPKPGAMQEAPAAAVIPDVLIGGGPGAWKIELNPETLPRLRINTLYERALSNHPHRALKDQLAEARWLIRGLEMRNETLLKTATAIFERQQNFLARGEEGMAPLTLREIAEAIGMHESTVCRVTTAKYVATPWGVYELKAFFPSQIHGAAGETSGTAVKAVIRRIIDTENRNSPLCDGDIAALLLRNGVRIARRTVAKYREAMHIAAAKDRRPRRTARAAAIAV